MEDLFRKVAALSAEQERLHESFRGHRLSPRNPSSNSRDPRPGSRSSRSGRRSPPKRTPLPDSAGTIAASAPKRNGALRPAPIATRETSAADISGGTCLLHNDRPPLHY
jgi:hypothetical protein